MDSLVLRNGRYSCRFKVQVIQYILKKRLSLSCTAAYFAGPHDDAISGCFAALQATLRKFYLASILDLYNFLIQPTR